jgi:hypothetical protein
VKPTSDKDLVYVNHEKHEITKSSWKLKTNRRSWQWIWWEN